MATDAARRGDSARHVLIGTAGHIDHGKTRLVGRLTGIDTDRLPEEKSRGISIDLGFAHWEAGGFRFGVVDVPGHERFVRNMVAGATGVNLALLVVAADDGVMPQTREHLDIMDLLGLSAGVVAVTKIDLVEPELVELVAEEVAEVTAGTFLEGCPIVPVSSQTGAGLDQLQDLLVQVASAGRWTEPLELFRMPIDRVFSIAGHGTVVTGSVLSGEVHAGDVLELWPAGREVRVRSVEVHGIEVEDSGARRRTAVNLAGVKQGEVHRGNELATPGYLRPTHRLLVELRTLRGSPMTLKNRTPVSLHLGTSEVYARVIHKNEPLEPGRRGWAELRTSEPVVAAWGQRFILRRISPQVTLAGGRVLDPAIPSGKRLRDPAAAGAALADPDETKRLAAWLEHRDDLAVSPMEAAWRIGLPPVRVGPLLEQLKSAGTLIDLGSRDKPLGLHKDRLQGLVRAVMRAIHTELARHQPRRALPRQTVVTACGGIARPGLLEAVLDHLLASGTLVEVQGNLGPADAQVQLTKKQQQARSAILDAVAGGGLTPPTTRELAEQLRQPLEEIETLCRLCVEEGLLVEASPLLYFTPQALEAARTTCREVLTSEGAATVSRLREAWGVSRKFSVPLCELLDRAEVTIRQDDRRRAGPAIDRPFTSDGSVAD